MRDTPNPPRTATLAALATSTARSRTTGPQVFAAIALTTLAPLAGLAALSTPDLAAAAGGGAIATGLAMHVRDR